MGDPTPAASRSVLRRLPMPAKLVLTVFLTTVGLGYLSAMVQLHLKHSSRDGAALPTTADVVERFSGLKPADPDAPPPTSKVDGLLAGSPADPDVGKANMAPAFFGKSKGYAADCGARGKAAVDAERATELAAVVAWCRADPAAKKAAYEADRFPLPDDLKGRPVTAAFAGPDGAVKVKSLVDARCQNCHSSQAPALGTWADLEPVVTPPSRELVDGKWVRSPHQVSVEGLTQSTHAHLLSFAVLFGATGLIFALTGYPGWFRGFFGPLVLVAQVADISCWWLARVPGYGPYFAMAIVGTGGAVGTGLMVQIVLGLFDLYEWRGRLVLAAVFLLGAAGLGAVGARVILPGLEAEKAAAGAAKEAAAVKPAAPAPAVTAAPAAGPVSDLERLVMGPVEGAAWNKKGSMAAAFFHKDEGGEYKKAIKDRPKAEVDAERDGERRAVQAWVKLAPDARKAAYEADRLPLPAALAGKPLTPDYLTDGAAAAKVKSILADRCARCHSEDGEQSDYRLDTYDHLLKYMSP